MSLLLQTANTQDQTVYNVQPDRQTRFKFRPLFPQDLKRLFNLYSGLRVICYLYI